jgi:hypothetical protein
MAGMPLQNRVLPTGEIVADARRGRELGASRWRSKLWICCVLDWRGWRRDPMPPGRWTALFFLDEATALAAGHRPCGYCRRADYLEFTKTWRAGQGFTGRLLATELDARLHAERVDRRRQQRTHVSRTSELPDGVMIRHGDGAGLLIAGQIRPWSLSGYGAPEPVSDRPADVLTPPSIVAAIQAGYRPLLHPSALAGLAGLATQPGPRGQYWLTG